MENNIVWHNATVSRERRNQQNQHKSMVLWFTGLSGSGKSTLAHSVEESLYQLGCRTMVLDGDNVRHGLCSDLSFSDKDRKKVRSLFPHGDFLEIFVDCPLEVCEGRDVKGLYNKACQGVIKDFTGINSPYEPPTKPELTVHTADQTLEESVESVLSFLSDRGLIRYQH